MVRLHLRDKLLLFGLVPVFFLCLGLHVQEVSRSGLAQPPIFAVPSNEGPYPVVGGARIERGQSWNGLEPGDTLIQIGDRDLAGAGYLSFDAIALETVNDRFEAPLIIERDGVRTTLVFKMLRIQVFPWYRIPLVCLMVLMAVVVVLRSPRLDSSYFYFSAALITGAIFQTPFSSERPLQTLIYQLIFNFGGAIVFALMIRAFIGFPEEMKPNTKLSYHWCWFGVVHPIVRLNYIFGGPIPPIYTPYATLVTDTMIASLLIGILTWNYFHALPIGKRRLVGFLIGIYVLVSVFIAVVLLLPWVESLDLPFSFSNSVPFLFLIGATTLAVGFMVGTIRYGFLEIDRLISPAALYSALLMITVGCVIALVPTLVHAVAGAAEIDVHVAQAIVAAAIAVTAVPMQRRLRPVVDRIFFPERLTMEQDFNLLRNDLAYCEDADDLLYLTGDRLATLLNPESCRVYRRTGDQFSTDSSDEWRTPPQFDAHSAVAQALESRPYVLRLDGAPLGTVLPWLSDRERIDLERLRASILVPVRHKNRLLAFVALGPSRSGENYSSVVVALLSAVSEKATDELQRMDSQQALERERERAAEMTALKEEAENANAAKSRFLAAASHDLRQPLHALGLFVEGLAARTRNDENLEIVQKIQASTNSLSEMFNDLLDISRLDAGVVEAALADIDLTPILDTLKSELTPLAEAKHLGLSFPTSRVRVHSDPMLLRRIIQNLLTNAIRYTDAGQISLEIRDEGRRLLIDVRDTGRGIDQTRQADIFQEFVHFDDGADSRTADAGLGLGLSIVRRLCDLMGHDLEWVSEPGIGSTFSIAVPPAQDQRGPKTKAPHAADTPEIRGILEEKWIVVIDDSPPILEAMQDLLVSWGCRVSLAACLGDVLDSIAHSSALPDAIVSDYHLGASGNGFDIIDAVEAELKRKTPFVMVSGDTSPERLREFENRGCPHLSKPVMPFKLRAVLSELVREK